MRRNPDSNESDEEEDARPGHGGSGGALSTPPQASLRGAPPGSPGTAGDLGADAASLRDKILQGSEVDLFESFSKRLQALHHRSVLSSQA